MLQLLKIITTEISSSYSWIRIVTIIRQKVFTFCACTKMWRDEVWQFEKNRRWHYSLQTHWPYRRIQKKSLSLSRLSTCSSLRSSHSSAITGSTSVGSSPRYFRRDVWKFQRATVITIVPWIPKNSLQIVYHFTSPISYQLPKVIYQKEEKVWQGKRRSRKVMRYGGVCVLVCLATVSLNC